MRTNDRVKVYNRQPRTYSLHRQSDAYNWQRICLYHGMNTEIQEKTYKKETANDTKWKKENLTKKTIKWYNWQK